MSLGSKFKSRSRVSTRIATGKLSRDVTLSDRYGTGFTREEKQIAIAAYGNVCSHCGLPFTADDPATVDHGIAKSRGGTNSICNAKPMHLSCHMNKLGKANKMGAKLLKGLQK